MNNKDKAGILILMFLIIVVSISSCHKNNTAFDYNQAIETVSDYVEAQQMTDLLLNTYFRNPVLDGVQTMAPSPCIINL